MSVLKHLSVQKYKVIIAGDIGVGKTTLVRKYLTGAFKGEYLATIGVEVSTKNLLLEISPIQLQLWDVAGQTAFQRFRKQFFEYARGALLVFDLTSLKTLTNIHHSWIPSIQAIAGGIPFVLVGNKADLRSEIVVKPHDIAKILAKNRRIITYLETSALTGKNVEQTFIDIATRIYSLRPL